MVYPSPSLYIAQALPIADVAVQSAFLYNSVQLILPVIPIVEHFLDVFDSSSEVSFT